MADWPPTGYIGSKEAQTQRSPRRGKGDHFRMANRELSDCEPRDGVTYRVGSYHPHFLGDGH